MHVLIWIELFVILSVQLEVMVLAKGPLILYFCQPIMYLKIINPYICKGWPSLHFETMTGVTISQRALASNGMLFMYIDHTCVDNK